MKISLILLNGLMSGAIAVPTSGIVHEKRNTLNSRWFKREALDANTKVPVRIALKQRNLDKGLDYLMEVSDPDSEKYGKHYTADEVVELFAPRDDSIAAVKSWLMRSGIPADKISSSKSKGWLDFETTSGQLETLLNTKYHVYDHVEARNAHIGTDSYVLPTEISPLVEFITPGVVFAQTQEPSKLQQGKRGYTASRRPVKDVPLELLQLIEANPQGTDNCDTLITPQCIKQLYNITDGSLASPNNKLGIFEASDDSGQNTDIYSQEDLDGFYALASPHIPAGTGPSVHLIDGATAPTTPSKAGGESDLDFEIAIPIIYPQKTELFQTHFRNRGIFNPFLDAVDGAYCTSTAYGETGDDPVIDGKAPRRQCGVFKPSSVISFSYGTAEVDYPTYYLQRQCDEFMKLGLQGSSIVFSSGDDGVARRSGPCLGPKQNIFTPGEPASCPYVTAVGATTLPQGSKIGDAEVATTEFSSGGGFSNIWTTPSYQSAAVSSYLANHNPGYPAYSTSGGKIPTSGGIYNKAGRGYPDLSANGQNGLIYWQGKPRHGAGGTSMAAPIVAGIFIRINEERIKIGKGPIGFANPALYKNPAMFNDVVVGKQDKGGPDEDDQPSACGNNGFSAVKGWDPVTGLGTPNYPAFLEYFLKL